VLTVVKSLEHHPGNTYEYHGQLSQGVEQTVPSIACNSIIIFAVVFFAPDYHLLP